MLLLSRFVGLFLLNLPCADKDDTAESRKYRPLQPGEAIVVDNMRLWHIREAFTDLRRRSWRVWMWTEGDCWGVPPEDHAGAAGRGDRRRFAFRKGLQQ